MTSRVDIWILHIETSTKACSVALSKNAECVYYKEFLGQNFSHAEKLPGFIEEVVAESEISKQDLSAIAISSGPGSYTGLRIGCSTAKGLSFSLGIPLISVDTLQISTKEVTLESEDDICISVMKARLKEIFIAIYSSNGVVRPTYYIDLNEDPLKEFRNNKVMFVGNATSIIEESVEPSMNWNFHHTDNAYKAKHMIGIAYQKFLDKDFEDLAYYEPFYLKDFVVLKKKTKA